MHATQAAVAAPAAHRSAHAQQMRPHAWMPQSQAQPRPIWPHSNSSSSSRVNSKDSGCRCRHCNLSRRATVVAAAGAGAGDTAGSGGSAAWPEPSGSRNAEDAADGGFVQPRAEGGAGQARGPGAVGAAPPPLPPSFRPAVVITKQRPAPASLEGEEPGFWPPPLLPPEALEPGSSSSTGTPAGVREGPGDSGMQGGITRASPAEPENVSMFVQPGPGDLSQYWLAAREQGALVSKRDAGQQGRQLQALLFEQLSQIGESRASGSDSDDAQWGFSDGDPRPTIDPLSTGTSVSGDAAAPPAEFGTLAPPKLQRRSTPSGSRRRSSRAGTADGAGSASEDEWAGVRMPRLRAPSPRASRRGKVISMSLRGLLSQAKPIGAGGSTLSTAKVPQGWPQPSLASGVGSASGTGSATWAQQMAAYDPEAARALTKRIQTCHSHAQLAQLVGESIGELNHVHISAALASYSWLTTAAATRSGRLGREEELALLDALTARLMASSRTQVKTMQSQRQQQGSSSSSNSSSRGSSSPRPSSASASADGSSGASAHAPPPPPLSAPLWLLSPKGISNVLAACAALNYGPPALLQALVQLLLRHADSCGPAELAECAAALTRLGVWDTLGPASSPATPSLRPGPAMQPVVRGAPSPEQQLQLLLRRMAACAKCRGFLDSASEAGVVLLLWCYSKAGHRDNGLLDELQLQFQHPRLRRYTAAQLAHALHSFSKLTLRPIATLPARLLLQISMDPEGLEPRNYVQLYEALAKWRVPVVRFQLSSLTSPKPGGQGQQQGSGNSAPASSSKSNDDSSSSSEDSEEGEGPPGDVLSEEWWSEVVVEVQGQAVGVGDEEEGEKAEEGEVREDEVEAEGGLRDGREGGGSNGSSRPGKGSGSTGGALEQVARRKRRVLQTQVAAAHLARVEAALRERLWADASALLPAASTARGGRGRGAGQQAQDHGDQHQQQQHQHQQGGPRTRVRTVPRFTGSEVCALLHAMTLIPGYRPSYHTMEAAEAALAGRLLDCGPLEIERAARALLALGGSPSRLLAKAAQEHWARLPKARPAPAPASAPAAAQPSTSSGSGTRPATVQPLRQQQHQQHQRQRQQQQQGGLSAEQVMRLAYSFSRLWAWQWGPYEPGTAASQGTPPAGSSQARSLAMHRLWAALMRTYAVPRLLQGGASSGAAGAQGTGAGQLFGPQDVGAVTMIVYACARMGHKDAGLLKLACAWLRPHVRALTPAQSLQLVMGLGLLRFRDTGLLSDLATLASASWVGDGTSQWGSSRHAVAGSSALLDAAPKAHAAGEAAGTTQGGPAGRRRAPGPAAASLPSGAPATGAAAAAPGSPGGPRAGARGPTAAEPPPTASATGSAATVASAQATYRSAAVWLTWALTRTGAPDERLLLQLCELARHRKAAPGGGGTATPAAADGLVHAGPLPSAGTAGGSGRQAGPAHTGAPATLAAKELAALVWAAAASNMQPIGFLPSAGEDLARYVAAGELSPRDLLLVLWCYASSRTYQERLLAAVKLALWHAMELDLEHQKELGREQQGRGRRQQQQQQQPSQRLPDLTAVGELGTDERGVYEAVVRSRRAAAALLREVKKRPGVRGKGGQADGVLAGMQAGKDGGSKAAGLILACFQRLGFDPGPRLGSWLKSLAG